MKITIKIERKKPATAAQTVSEMVHIAEHIHRLEAAMAALDSANVARHDSDPSLTPVFSQLHGQVMALRVRQAALLASYRQCCVSALV